MRFAAWWGVALAAVAAVAVVAVAAPLPDLPLHGRIRYVVVRGDGNFELGRATHEWQRDGKHYVLSSTTQATGLLALLKPAKIVQRSEGQMADGGLRPDTFLYDRGDGDAERVHFDWEAKKATFRQGDPAALEGQVEDTLSMFYQLSLLPPRSEAMVIPVATGRKVERYKFNWLGEEPVALKAGRFDAWHVRIVPVTGGDTTEVWLGKSVAGLPIKIRFTDRKGGVIEQLAEEIDFEGKQK